MKRRHPRLPVIKWLNVILDVTIKQLLVSKFVHTTALKNLYLFGFQSKLVLIDQTSCAV